MLDNTSERMQQQMRFLIESDKIKHIFRMNNVMDGSRRENDAEHSWSLALMTMVLSEYAPVPIDTARVMKMLVIHDLVEIDAGDTFAYDAVGLATQGARELAAADRIFNLLPSDLAAEFRGLWDEFERRETPEARFAMAIDHLGGVLPNYHNDGGGWKENGISVDRVLERNQRIGLGSPALWDYARGLIDDAVAKGFISS